MKKSAFLGFLFSTSIVILGQPAWVSWLAPITAALGYGLFWKSARMLFPVNRRIFFSVCSLWFMGVQLFHLSWMTSIQFYSLYMLFFYGLLCFVLGLQFGLLSLCVGRLPHFVVATLGVVMEWMRWSWFTGFSWNPLGITLAAFPVSAQLASLWGVLGLSFWVLLTNLAFFQGKIKTWTIFTLVPYLFGLASISFHNPRISQYPSLQVAVVQTQTVPVEKAPHAFRGAGKEALFLWSSLLEQMAVLKGKKWDIVLMPEAIVPYSLDRKLYPAVKAVALMQKAWQEAYPEFWQTASQSSLYSNADIAQSIANFLKTDLILGLETQGKNGEHYNSACHFSYKQGYKGCYNKQKLLPIGEYLPFSFLKDWSHFYTGGEFFSPGKGEYIFSTPIPSAASICYEETFPQLSREQRKKGAQLFLGISNDAWYPHSKLAAQHFYHSRLRSIENGVPQLRACNGGFSGGCDSLGRVQGNIGKQEQAEVLSLSLPIYSYSTLYTQIGDAGVLLVLVGLSLASLFLSRKSFGITSNYS